MKGCVPSLGIGMRKLLEKRFRVKMVDEYKTSKTCNSCYEVLKRYSKRDGKLSHSRLCCVNSAECRKDRSKQFVDSDLTLLQTFY